jgi:hypothetical protein
MDQCLSPYRGNALCAYVVNRRAALIDAPTRLQPLIGCNLAQLAVQLFLNGFQRVRVHTV